MSAPVSMPPPLVMPAPPNVTNVTLSFPPPDVRNMSQKQISAAFKGWQDALMTGVARAVPDAIANSPPAHDQTRAAAYPTGVQKNKKLTKSEKKRVRLAKVERRAKARQAKEMQEKEAQAKENQASEMQALAFITDMQTKVKTMLNLAKERQEASAAWNADYTQQKQAATGNAKENVKTEKAHVDEKTEMVHIKHEAVDE